ncbi:unnamed protein product (macronuclear) [Paramecium tetraurelia]|uniref:Uncharacterized protein n=1 Tax=Paramecium tetraurelia TaxID=5888 RepID=A0BIF1_PARTE|nr:uncharacterized protein GSPATT00004690001 [Paramecium tetraurelia]CAK58318.1 unnamed protein product [Paramecium tetraurelia]|eukprot:XP_001425716.1 hypothetical protein (macronuclear) [Paramecium tetraurelia strain d4-2]
MSIIQNTSQEIRINNLQTDLKQLSTNTNLYMLQSQDEIAALNERINQIINQQNQHASSLNVIQEKLNQRVEKIFLEHEASLINKIKEIEEQKLTQHEEEIKKREEMFNKFVQLDQQVDKLDKKFELKANDKFIVSTIQNNLMNNQLLQQTLIDKAIKLIDDLLKQKVEEMQKWTDEKIQQQYYQIQNFSTYLRKSERVVEELQSAITLTKNSTIEFEKEFTQQINDISQKNQIFKETITIQTKGMLNQSSQIKQQFDQLEQKIQLEFQNIIEKQSIITNQIQTKVDQMNHYIQFCLDSSEQKVYSLCKQEDQELMEKLTNQFETKFKTLQEKTISLDQELNKQSEICNQTKEKLNNFLKSQQVHQRLYQKKDGMPQYNSKQSVKDQLLVIENLFRYISQIYSQIHKSIRTDENEQLQTIQDSTRHSQSCSQVVLLVEQCQSTKKIHVSPNKSPERVEKVASDKMDLKDQRTLVSSVERNKGEIHKNQDKSPLITLEKPIQAAKIGEEIFSDQKLQETNHHPLLVVGKTQLLDIRPQQDLFSLQQKVKKIQGILGVDLLGQRQNNNIYQAQRCNSASKRLPKINSRNLNFSID